MVRSEYYVAASFSDYIAESFKAANSADPMPTQLQRLPA
jgi:hypothetical protein